MRRIALLCALLASAVAHSETLYVSDRLTLNLREGPSSTADVLRPSLNSGDALEVVGRDDGGEFLEVVTEDGRRGWVHGQYLISTPIARDRLQAAEERIAALLDTIAAQRAELDAAGSGAGHAPVDEALKAQMDGLGRQIEELKGLLARPEPKPAEQPPEMVRTLRDHWPVLGFGLFVIGLVLGLIISARPKHKAWS